MDCYAEQHEVADLPEDTLVFLLGSRCCEIDLLTRAAWIFSLGQRPAGTACD
jgi:hypothetical protein